MSTYTSYNSYLGSKSCCNTICQEKCNNSSGSTGITGPAGPAGPAGAQGPTGSSANQNLQQVLALGNSAGSQSATDFNNVGAVSVETGKVYQGNFLSLQLGETGDTLQIKGATNLGSMLVGNSVNTEELAVGADGLFLKADSGASLGVSWAAPPTLQEVLTAGNTALNTDIILTSSLPTTNTISSGGMVTTGILNLNGDSVSINTTGNNVGINSGTSVNIVATDGVYLTASNDPMTLTSAALMTLNSTADAITLQAAGDINLTSPTLVKSGDTTAATTGYLFVAEVSEQYSTSNGGRAARCDDANTIGTTILKKCNYFSTDGDCILLKYTEYANYLQPNKDGWFCYIQNYSGSIINVTTDDVTPFYGNGAGNQSSYAIPAYTTARFTLTYISNLSPITYIWSVLQG